MRCGCLCRVLVILVATAGCAGRSPDAVWGAQWPTGAELRESAVSAARSPATWAPLAGAAVLSVGDLDEDLSRWASEETPLFGSGAESASDDLRNVARAAWLVTALVVPSDAVGDRVGGLMVGASTLALEDAVTSGIKELSKRPRPDGSDDRSFSSGHAGGSSAPATLARRNLDYLDLPPWADVSLRVGLYSVAVGTGWARVEAGRHYVTDVLAGYAVGHFLAAFMQEAFMRSALPPVQVRFQPLGQGGTVTVVFHGPSCCTARNGQAIRGAGR